MKIIGAHYNDNTVSAIYRGEDLIYTVKEICIEPIAGMDETGGYIYIDDLELQYGYKYEIDFAAPDSYPTILDVGNNHHCIIGGSYSKSGDNYYGIFLGYPYSSYAEEGIGFRTNTYLRSGGLAPKSCTPYTLGVRQTIVCTHTESGDQTRTDGGFFLFGNRAYDTGELYVTPDGSIISEQTLHLFGRNSVGDCGKFYRITIKDSNDIVLKDFIPYKMNGHKGVYDRVSGKFYACADDTKFRIRRA